LKYLKGDLGVGGVLRRGSGLRISGMHTAELG